MSSQEQDTWPTRCPVCHDAIFAARDDFWVACAGCFTRHHEECWGERGGCGSCGGVRALVLEDEAPPVRRSRRARASAAGEPAGERRSMTLAVVAGVACSAGFIAGVVSKSTTPLFVASIVVVVAAVLGAIEERRFLRDVRRP